MLSPIIMCVVTGIDHLDTPTLYAHGNNGSNSVQLIDLRLQLLR